MADDCYAGFALFPLLMIVFFVVILTRALRTASYSGGYRSYGGRANYRYYGNSLYALQYLGGQSRGQQYQSQNYTGYSPQYAQQPAYGTPQGSPPYYAQGQAAYATYSSGSTGSGFASAPPPAYSAGQPAGYAPSAPSAPEPEVPKVSCSYCGSLNPGSEQNCLLCGAPMK